MEGADAKQGGEGAEWKEMGPGGGIGWAGGARVLCGCRSGSRKPPASHFDSNLRKKARPDRSADQYRSALDGFCVPKHTEGLRIGVGDALTEREMHI